MDLSHERPTQCIFRWAIHSLTPPGSSLRFPAGHNILWTVEHWGRSCRDSKLTGLFSFIALFGRASLTQAAHVLGLPWITLETAPRTPRALRMPTERGRKE